MLKIFESTNQCVMNGWNRNDKRCLFLIMKKFIDAFRGIGFVLQGGGFSFHVFAAIVSIVLGFCFNISTIEWCFILFSIGSVIAAEIFNSSIEQICNFIEPNQNNKIGKIKDMGAGAVLVLAIMSFIVGAIIFIPKIMELW